MSDTVTVAVDAAIHRVRRDLTLGAVVKLALGATAIACLIVGPEGFRLFALVAVASVWFWLSLNGARSSRVSAQSPSLIAAGQFEAAERNIDQTVRQFSIFRAVKLSALHHLALLRHAQRRWQESAALARELLSQRLGALQSLSRSARLLLADSLLELNDLAGVYYAIIGLYHQRLSLAEMLNLLIIQLDYDSRIGAWQPMVQNVAMKVQMAELMPAPASARTQALLSLAASKTGHAELSDWLKRRVELLADVQRLASERPVLWELWRAAP